MFIPKDKFQHMAAGLMVVLFVVAAWFVFAPLLHAPLAGLPLAVIITGVVAGIVKEVCDWLDNRANPAVATWHDVSVLDALATAAPALVIGIAIFTYLMQRR